MYKKSSAGVKCRGFSFQVEIDEKLVV